MHILNIGDKMKTRKERQLMIASILLEMGMEDETVAVITDLPFEAFQHLKN